MNSRRPSTYHYHTVHSSNLQNSSINDTTISSDCSQQADSSNHQRNNHNSDFISHDELSKSINDRKQRTRYSSSHNQYHQKINKKTSLFDININLLNFIRFIIFCVCIIIISSVFYRTLVNIYPRQKSNGWKKILDWLHQE